MIRKTYGVSGLMDWTTQIKAGKGAVSVHFTGGALTAYGVTPAKFSTSNPFFQQVIENSEHFKGGRIKLLGVLEVPDDDATKARKARARAAQPKATDAAAAKEMPKEKEADAKDNDDTVQKVEVPDRYEALEYLKEHFPDKEYTATKLRTKAALDAACKECHIEFVFTA